MSKERRNWGPISVVLAAPVLDLDTNEVSVILTAEFYSISISIVTIGYGIIVHASGA
jgi:hypothetical protein